MHSTDELYNSIVSDPLHYFETSLSIGLNGVIVTETGEDITFGGDSIIVSSVAGEDGVREDVLMSLKTSHKLFDDDKPAIGCCVSGEITVEMIVTGVPIPRMARLVPYVRACVGNQKSEWIKKGIYFVDTRTYDVTASGAEVVTLHGYDAMLKADADLDADKLESTVDIDVVRNIAEQIGCFVEQRTIDIMTGRYNIGSPIGYTCREVLGYIAAMYAGNFIISDDGGLMLVALNALPEPTNYLIDDNGFNIVWDDSQGLYHDSLRILV